MKMVEGVDYCFIYPKEDEETVHIRLMEGPYKDTIYKYGRVGFEEKNEQVYLQFKFDVIESSIQKKKLEKNNDFRNYIGDLLVEIMSSNIEQEIIDETGTIDSEESGL
jgi:hypothetical protein